MRIPAAHRLIVQDLNGLLRKLPPVIWYGLPETEKEREAAGTLSDAKTKELRVFTGSWTDFLDKYRAWRADMPERLGEGDLLSTLMSMAQGPDSDWGALRFDDQQHPPAPLPREADVGIVRFTVADPIGLWTNVNEYDIVARLIAQTDLINLLSPLEGTLWRPSAIRSQIEQYLSDRGFRPVVEVSAADRLPKKVNIRPGERIARILFTPPSDSHTDLDRTLYILLPDREFRRYINSRATAIKDLPGPPKLQQVDLADLGVTLGMEPYFNVLDFQAQQLELAPLGLKLGEIQSRARSASDELPYVDLLVEKQSDEESGDTGRSAAAPVNVSPEGIVRAPTATVSSAPATTSAPTPGDAPPPKNLANYIGGGFEYNPGQGVRPLVVYQRTQLLGEGGLSLQSGTVNEHPVVFGNFYLDFAGFSKLARRLSLQTSGSSDFSLHRQFYKDVLDERRTGGLVRFELELFRNRNGQLLKTFLEGRRATVDLLRRETTTQKVNLTTLDFGGTYVFEQNSSPHPRRLHVEPVFRRGLNQSATEDAYMRFSVTANFHQRMLGPAEFDLSGSVGAATDRTPVFELLSFGGEATVRGFRQDDILARQIWTAQPEFWAPIPVGGAATQGPKRFLRQNVRLALFSDFGHVAQTLGPLSGWKAGPGAGVRIRYGLVILKLDWAKPIGGASTQNQRGRFYFSVVTTKAF